MSELLDPDSPTSGFHRSLVGRLSLRGAELAATEDAPAPDVSTALPGPAVGGLALTGSPVAGSSVPLRVTFAPNTAVPADLELGLRWDALALDPLLPADATAVPGPGLSPAASPLPSTSPTPATSPASTPSAAPHAPGAATAPASASPGPSDGTAADPAASLVKPEVPGAVVLVSPTAATQGGLETKAAVPARPGLYRLVVTLHDPDGVAFDAATQDRLPALIVRVTGTLSATFAAPANLSLVAGTAAVVPVTSREHRRPSAGRNGRCWTRARTAACRPMRPTPTSSPGGSCSSRTRRLSPRSPRRTRGQPSASTRGRRFPWSSR